MDFITGGQRVEVFGFVQVPKHGGAVFAAGRTEGAVGRNGDGIDVADVSDVIGLDSAGGKFPDLWYRVVSEISWRQVSVLRKLSSIVISALVIVCLMVRRL